MQGDVKIGEWLVQPRINSLELDGRTVHLEPKVMQVLLALAKEPGEVVGRETLRNTVWPDVFVGEDVLIRAISELRRAFRDDPKTPHTIQTIPKVGYRLIAPVQPIPEVLRTVTSAEVHHSALPVEIAEGTQRVPPSRGFSRYVIGIVACAGVLFASIGIWFAAHSRDRQGAYTVRPLTTEPGFQLQPALSPDGSTVAFVWSKPGESDGHIYIKAVNSEQSARLTSASVKELSPAWSPDGKKIAFLQQVAGGYAVEVMSAVGGTAQPVYMLPDHSVWEYGGLAWSSDGQKLIFPARPAEDQASHLVQLDLETRTTTNLTSPQPDWDGDWTPAVSPDGKWLSFVRGEERSARDLYLMQLPSGNARPLTKDHALIVGQTWSADGSKIVFASSRVGNVSLWSVDLNGDAPVREQVGSDSAYAPTIARHADRLAYSRGNADWSVNRLSLANGLARPLSTVLSSTEQDSAPTISPDDSRIAFQSWRSGKQEIWTVNSDGSNLSQLTSGGHYAGSPAWSPDGHSICFDARVEGISHIFLIDANGGIPRQVTDGKDSDIVPSWSPDGKSIFFGSTRSGKWEIWRLDLASPRQPHKVTGDGGMVGKPSPDGHWLYFTRFAEAGLWRQQLPGGTSQKVSDNPPQGFQNYWTPVGDGVLMLAPAKGGDEIRELNLKNHLDEVIFTLPHPPSPFAGMAVTADQKFLYLAWLDHAGSNLRIVDGFR